MALTPQSNEAFLREVDDELRRDQLMSVWQRYGRWIIVAVIAGLALFGGYLFWQHRSAVAAGEQGEKLQAVDDSLTAGNPAQAAAPLDELSRSKRDGYRALALFAQADQMLKGGDTRGASAKLAAIAGDALMPKPFRDLATVRQTAAEYDQLKPQVVIERLRSLTIPGNAWYGSAGEMTAIARLRLGQRALAGQMFGQIGRDANVPESIRQRAVQMAGVLGVDAVAQNEGSPSK